ncbi:hypothetical protein BJX61DRAFT_537895 [Aspergillus egyptiacus]|nr:hypothetical protein BJX61DRAFT_537895 [Aspergillus egyptiacus]
MVTHLPVELSLDFRPLPFIDCRPFWDSDIYKIAEAACYFLMKDKDDELMATVEEAADMIRAAQHPDNYINSYYTVLGIDKSGRLLEPVLNALRHADSVFGNGLGKKRGYPVHQEIEIGLLRLYELSTESFLLSLAKYFISERDRRDGKGGTYFDHEARAGAQDPYDHFGGEMKAWFQYPRDIATTKQIVRWLRRPKSKDVQYVLCMYYYTAATDLVRLAGDKEIRAALDRMWIDLTETKLYITGGIGAMRQWGGFGGSYVLSDTEESGTCYAATCAFFALIIWCKRILQLVLDIKYADFMKIGLYNGFLGAVGLDDCSFYYQDPLRTYTGHPKERSGSFEVACCPPHSYKENLVAVHLPIESAFAVPGTDVIKVKGSTGLALRITSWANEYTSSVQGQARGGYLHIPPGKDQEEQICIMRGPLVYCIEDVDNDVDVDHVGLIDGPVSDGEPIDISGVNGVIPVEATGREVVKDKKELYAPEPWKHGDKKKLLYVPYLLRANRGVNGGMTVWARRLNT